MSLEFAALSLTYTTNLYGTNVSRIWTDSAQSWVTPCEAAEQVAGNPS